MPARRIKTGSREEQDNWGLSMVRLILFRHGQAVPHDHGSDLSRSLTETGRRETAATANLLHEAGIHPDLALVSAAARTSETWDVLKAHFPDAEARVERDLYLATPELIVSLIHQLPQGPRCVVIVGHNPALHDLALEFYGFGDRYALARLREEFPTAAAAVFDFEQDDWSALKPQHGRLDRFVSPEKAIA